MNTIPRYSRRAFPAYRFIPGRTPHPTRDPDGHSYGAETGNTQRRFDAPEWHRSDTYLYGVDLYNHGYWWEAHEAWEACWIAAGKSTREGLFLQGLIQIAAGCLKKYQGNTEAGHNLARDGLEKFPPRTPSILGIELQPFHQAVEEFFAGKRKDQPVIELILPDSDQDTREAK